MNPAKGQCRLQPHQPVGRPGVSTYGRPQAYCGTRRRFGLGAQMRARRSAEVADAGLDQDTLGAFRAAGSIASRDRILAGVYCSNTFKIYYPSQSPLV